MILKQKKNNFLIPLILSEKNKSLVINDPDGSLFLKTSGARSSFGSVYRYDWSRTEESEKKLGGSGLPSWNPLGTNWIPYDIRARSSYLRYFSFLLVKYSNFSHARKKDLAQALHDFLEIYIDMSFLMKKSKDMNITNHLSSVHCWVDGNLPEFFNLLSLSRKNIVSFFEDWFFYFSKDMKGDRCAGIKTRMAYWIYNSENDWKGLKSDLMKIFSNTGFLFFQDSLLTNDFVITDFLCSSEDKKPLTIYIGSIYGDTDHRMPFSVISFIFSEMLLYGLSRFDVIKTKNFKNDVLFIFNTSYNEISDIGKSLCYNKFSRNVFPVYILSDFKNKGHLKYKYDYLFKKSKFVYIDSVNDLDINEFLAGNNIDYEKNLIIIRENFSFLKTDFKSVSWDKMNFFKKMILKKGRFITSFAKPL